MLEQLKKIKMVDVFIIIILIILIMNIGASIFIADDVDKQIATRLDLGFRTTLSSIVGYVLSSNFISNKVDEKKECKIIVDEAAKKKEKNVQLYIVGSVAVSTLLLLTVARHFCSDYILNASNVSVIYDICVGCIGFLIGYTD